MSDKKWWKNYYGRKTDKFYWFDMTVDEVALISNSLYHDLKDGTYKTMFLFIEYVDKTYTIIAIVSPYKLNRKQVLAAIDEVPCKEDNDNWLGDR